MTEKPSATGTAPEEAKRAGAISDFGIDTTSRTTGEALADYFARLRGGELGALPALAGLIVLVIYFASQSEFFLSLRNVANLFAQGAGIVIIAMGLVFVLLLGEIDLAAGTASGVCASIMALHLVRNGNMLGGMGSSTTFYVFCALLVVAAGLALYLRIWPGVVMSLVALGITLSGATANPWLEMLLALSVGTAIGCITGYLVAKIGMPSFVVTLALFITWQGVILKLIGQGGTLPISQDKVLNGVANSNLTELGSWIFFVIIVGGYAAVALGQHFRRLNRGLVTQPTPLVLAKVIALAVLGAVGTYLMTINRGAGALEIRGIPYVVPIVLGLMIIGGYTLNRTRYGRHIYAVGGNAEAARRAGINVPKLRASVFVISSSFAAIGAIVYSSKVGSVDPQAGGLNTLLFAVGAAVIGGTSLFGGKGKITDAVIGGTVIAVVQNGLQLLSYGPAEINIITGIVLLIAATVDALTRRRANANKS